MDLRPDPGRGAGEPRERSNGCPVEPLRTRRVVDEPRDRDGAGSGRTLAAHAVLAFHQLHRHRTTFLGLRREGELLRRIERRHGGGDGGSVRGFGRRCRPPSVREQRVALVTKRAPGPVADEPLAIAEERVRLRHLGVGADLRPARLGSPRRKLVEERARLLRAQALAVPVGTRHAQAPARASEADVCRAPLLQLFLLA